MNTAAYCKLIFALICIIWVWTFYLEEQFANYYKVYFTDGERDISTSNIPCPDTYKPHLVVEDDIVKNRERTIEILSYNNSKLKLEYSDTTWQICIMMKNQAPDVAEWIEYQYLMGATHISIYDHESTDNLTDVLKVYMDKKTREVDPYFPQIELIKWPPSEYTDQILAKRRQYLSEEEHEDVVKKVAICKAGIGLAAVHASGRCQQSVIADCATRFRNRRDWLSWHDVDEFFWVVPDKDAKTIPTVSSHLSKASSDLHSIYLNPMTFGTNDYENRSYELLVETHLQRAPYKDLGEPEEEVKNSLACKSASDSWGICEKGGGKSITRANDKWKTTNAGSPHYIDNVVQVQYIKYPMRMNHYQMKSVEEAEIGSRKQNKDWSYKAAKYASGFWNYVHDDGLGRFSPEIRKRLEGRRTLN